MSALLVVNECKVNAVGRGASYWFAYLERNRGRIRERAVSLGGAICEVTCESREDAEWLRDHLVEQGLPLTAFKIEGQKPSAADVRAEPGFH